ncbi:MAG: hypothetical protein PWQ82_249 [Thermosediminibacterales bacterium]|nr:hypothetical protein [Thermosediminibacterales bacterium]MDK2835271.1 hypothetical protein [Thermosediminibacterales bacterium]
MGKSRSIFFAVFFLIFLIVFPLNKAAASYIYDSERDKYILLNIPSLTLKLFENEKLIRTYPVAAGKSITQTPIGEFKINNKIINPYWYPKGKPPVPLGPDNPLGTRWLGLQDGYGIHGNNNPNSIGTFVSLGCIRLYNKDIEELFDMVKIGTVVTVTYETIEIVNNENDKYIVVYPDVYNLGVNKPKKILSVIHDLKIDIPEEKLKILLNLVDEKKVFLTNGYIITLNNEPITTDVFIKDGVVFVEKEAIMKSLDLMQINEDVLCKTINQKNYISLNDLAKFIEITFSIDEEIELINIDINRIRLNGYFLTAYKKNSNNKPLIPLRRLAEACGQKIEWDPIEKKVKVNEKPVEVFLKGSSSYITTEKAKELFGIESIHNIKERTIDLYHMKVIVDNNKFKEEDLLFKAGEFFIPLRPLAQRLGYNVLWDGKHVLIDEKVVKSEIVDGRAYIKVKDIGEIFNVYVGWNPKSGEINVISGKRRN